MKSKYIVKLLRVPDKLAMTVHALFQFLAFEKYCNKSVA